MHDLILIHGALGAAAQMSALAAACGPNARVHVLELEGHGATAPRGPGFSIEGFADNVRHFMLSRRVARADLFGYSMGGYVALWLAAESPELVASVTTLGTKLAWTPEVAAAEARRLDPATIRAQVPKFAELLERRHEAAGGWKGVLANTAALMTELGAHPLVDDHALKRIVQPVRLLVGDRDSIVTVEETASAARTIALGGFGVLPNTPHPIEQVSVPLLTSLLANAIS